MERDPKTWEEIPPDFLGDADEDVEAYCALETVCAEHGLLEYERDANGEILLDERGLNLFRVNLPQEVAPAPLTIRDRSGPPRDAMDEVLAVLPWTATKRAKAEALLRANCTGPEIIAKLRVSPGTVAAARAAILREYDERVGRGEQPDALAEAITNPIGRANRGQPRPDMVHGSGTSMMERRAADLGVTVEEAIQLRADARRARKFKETTEDLALNMRRVRRRV